MNAGVSRRNGSSWPGIGGKVSGSVTIPTTWNVTSGSSGKGSRSIAPSDAGARDAVGHPATNGTICWSNVFRRMNLSVISSPTPRCRLRRGLVVEHHLVDLVGVEPPAFEDLPPVEGGAQRAPGHRQRLEVDLAEAPAVGGAAEEEEEAGPGRALDLGQGRDLVEIEVLGQEVATLGDAGVARRRRGEEPFVGGVGATGGGGDRDGGPTGDADQERERDPTQ